MKCLTTARIWLTILSLIILLPVFSVPEAAGRRVLEPVHPQRGVQVSLLPQADLAAAGRCKRLEITSLLEWYAVDDKGEANPGEEVDSYPSGTIALSYGFDYRCVPERITVTELFYALDYSDEPVTSEEIALPADPRRGGLYWTITLKDKKPFPDGKYRVEFYLDEEFLVGGETTVGDGEQEGDIGDEDRVIVAHSGRTAAEETPEPEESETLPTEEPEPEPEPTATPTRAQREPPTRDNKIQIEGEVIDGTTGRPIAGAVFVVLHPGISVAQWANYGFPPSDILSSNTADRDGRFGHPGLEIGVEYSIIVWALSYQGWWKDGFRLTESDPDPYPLVVQLFR